MSQPRFPSIPAPSLMSIARWQSGRGGPGFWLTLVLLLLVNVGCRPALEQADRAALRLTTEALEPGTRFEVVFDDPVARSEVLGTPTDSPLQVEPPLAGDFVWRSRRSGMFTPTEPMKLGTRYTFSLKRDLKDASGAVVHATLRRSFRTPPLLVSVRREGWWPDTDAPVVPLLILSANARIDAATLARHTTFLAGGIKVRALVEAIELPSTNAPAIGRFHQLEPTWAERFPGATNAQVIARTSSQAGRSSGFLVRPERPLDLSTNEWRLEITPGVESVEAGVRMEGPATHVVGRCLPFELVTIEAANHLAGRRQLRLRFSRQVSPIVTNLPAQWFRCQPEVTGFRAERSPGGQSIAISGDFAIDQTYTVSLAPEFPGVESVTLRPFAPQQLRFEPIEPSVWLHGFDSVQLATGQRKMELLAVNTPETRLRMKALGQRGLIPTLRAYERYLRRNADQPPDVLPGGPLDFTAIPGRTVLDTNLVTQGGVDQSVRLDRTWDDFALRRLPESGGNGPLIGAFFIEADLHNLPSNEAGVRTRVGPQALVQLTDLGFVLKTGEKSTLAWVFSHHTGKSVAGASVSLRSGENEVLAEAVTDAMGLARLPKSSRAEWLLAERSGDLHAQRLVEGQVPLWSLSFEHGRDDEVGAGDPVKLYSFADRDAFRPGEKVHLQVLARRWDATGWQFPTNTAVALKLTGPRGDAILRTNLVLQPGGSAEWEWTSLQGTRGTFLAHLECGGGSSEHSFEVREFQPAAFEVLLGGKPSYGPAEPLEIPVGARYLFGEPLSQAQVRWHARATDQTFAPPGWESFRFGQGLNDWRLLPGEFNGGGVSQTDTVRLTAGTALKITPELAFNPIHPQPQAVEFHVEVTDLNQQTISQTREMVRHPSEFYLGFRWTEGAESLLATQESLKLQAVAVRSDGQPWPEVVDVSARLQRVEWKTVAVLEAGRTVGLRSEPEFQEVAERSLRTQLVVRSGERWQVGDETTSAAEFPGLKEPGTYVVDLTARDPANRPVRTRISFSVWGDGRLAWHQRNGAQVDLLPDRREYQTGESASFLLKAPFPGTALVTLEREEVSQAFTTEIRGNAPRITLPLGTNTSPNVFVSVLLVRGVAGNPHAFPMPEWRVGVESVSVTARKDQLKVRVQTADPVRRPGDPVRLTARVVDAADQPVAGAPVTLYAVDEGYLTLTGLAVPAPAEAFAAPRPLKVGTLHSLWEIQPEDPELRHFENKGYLAGGGGRHGPARRNFIPCPYWNTALVTDARGEVMADFTAPDSLTRYRVVAVATHGARAMAAGATSFEVRKELMIDSALPRFAHVGDRLVARALVFNQTDHVLKAHASLVPGAGARFEPGSDGRLELELPPGRATVVEFPVHLQAPAQEPWRWRVEADGLSDESVATLPILRPEPLLRDVRQFRLSSVTNLLIGADPAVLELPESVTLRMAASPLALLGEGVDQLLHYPYGCVEQTGSSLLPWLALKDFPELLPAERRDPTNFTAAVQVGVLRFWSMQTPSGGLAYWPGGNVPQRWGSAYAAWILARARDAGMDVSTNRLARLQQWLRDQWRADAVPVDATALHERCLTAFALAAGGVGETSLHFSLQREVDRLTAEDRALLALAELKTEGVARSTLFESPPGKALRGSYGRFGNDSRVTALRLLAFSQVRGYAPQAVALEDALLAARDHGHWVTTQGNAWALWALTEQTRRRATTTAVTGSLRLDGREQSFRIDREHPVVSLIFDAASWTWTNGIQLNPGVANSLFAEVTLVGRRPTGTNLAVALDRGFQIQRRYERLDEQNRPQPIEPLSVGDRVLVTLEISAPEPAEWVAIEDPLPTALEAVQGVFKTDATAAPGILPEWSSDFWEVRLDRTLIFRDELPEGRHVIRYLARVRAAGDVRAAPAKIEAMYDPQRHGYSGSSRLRVTALPH